MTVDGASSGSVDPPPCETVGTPRWPLVLWASQLLFPGAVLVYGAFRWLSGGAPPGRVLAPAIVIAAAWTVLAVWVLFFPRSRSWLVAHRAPLLLSCVSAIVSLSVVDAGLTLTGIVPTVAELRRRSVEFRPGVGVRHRMVPGVIRRGGSEDVRINGRGWRGKEFSLEPEIGVTRILFLGGSHVFDFAGGNWPERTGALLREAGHSVEILNGAVPGYTTADSLSVLLLDAWTLEPDVVVICQEWNDIKYFGKLTAETPYMDATPVFKPDWRTHPRGLDRILSLSSFYRIKRQSLIYHVIGGEGVGYREPQPSFGELGPRQYALDLKMLVEAARGVGAQPVLCLQSRLPTEGGSEEARQRISYEFVGLDHEALLEAFRSTDRAIRKLANEEAVPLIDLHEGISGRAELFLDHIHFNEEGSRAAAASAARQLLPLVQEWNARTADRVVNRPED